MASEWAVPGAVREAAQLSLRVPERSMTTSLGVRALTASHEHLGPKEARREGPTGMALTVTRYRVGVQAPAIS